MNRAKRNRNNPIRDTDGYIKKYFGSDISKILVSSMKSIQNCPTPYVPHPEAEKVLGDILIGDPQKDKSIVFTGLKGSGKSTILRHVFDIEGNSNRAKICGRTVIIPIDFNRSQISAQIAILSSMRAAIGDLCDAYRILEPDINNTDFYEFVKKVRKDMLYINGKLCQDAHKALSVFYDTAPIPFSSCQLQYVLNSSFCDIKMVVLVVDNVEGFAGNKKERLKYLEPVIEALRLYDCIAQRQQPTGWCFNMVIACRHYIWRLIRGEEDENGAEIPLIESFTTSEKAYDLRKPVEIDQIVEARDAAFSRDQSSKRWKTSVSVVRTILAKMEGTLGDFVLQLELKDIRKSLETMQSLILHSGLQNKTEEEINNSPGSFQIDSTSQFDLTRINLIRTLATGNYTYYTDKVLIPNLLFNHQEEGLELYPLLTLKYFLERCGYIEPAWDNSISIFAFYQTMKEVFGFSDKQVQKWFAFSVHYFIKNRILLRSADQQQDEVPGLTKKEIQAIENVYVSGAAVRLWEELRNSSALFQLFMDDVYVGEESPYLDDDGNDIEHCFEYLKYLRIKEERIFNMVANQSKEKVQRYIQCFGDDSICAHLAYGLLNSLAYIAEHDPSPKGRKARKTLLEVEIFTVKINKWSKYLGMS